GPLQLPDAAILLGLRRGSAFTPKRCLRSLFRLILPAIEERLSNAVSPTCLGDISTFQPFLDDLPLLFGSSINLWSPAHLASSLGGSDSTYSASPVSAGSTTPPFPGLSRIIPCTPACTPVQRNRLPLWQLARGERLPNYAPT